MPAASRFIGFLKSGLGADGNDTALTVRLLIARADGAAQGAGDVVDKHLVVELDGLLQDLGAVIHGVAVAVIKQLVVMRCELINSFWVNGLACDEDVAHSALHGLIHVVEKALLILYAGAVNGGVILKGQARHMVEAAELARQSMHGPLERVQHLLAGDLDDGKAVAEGMDLEDVVEGDIALVDGHADAAAVDECDIGFTRLIKIGIRAEVAEVGLGAADDTNSLTVVGKRTHKNDRHREEQRGLIEVIHRPQRSKSLFEF